MRVPVDQSIVYSVDWISDPWIAKAVKPTAYVTVAPTWEPPDALDEWPTFDAHGLLRALGTTPRGTRPLDLSTSLDDPPDDDPADAQAATARFFRMEAETRRHGDVRMVQQNHVRAWLSTAVGTLLRGLLLSADAQPEVLVQTTAQRLLMPFAQPLPVSWMAANDYEEKRLDLLYNLTIGPTGALSVFEPADVRVGQGETWREHWDWLSEDIGFGETRDAVRLAARIMRCEPVVVGLLLALGSNDPGLRTVALAVVRRWLLTLKAMAWLEESVAVSWRHVRAQDLACFAFNAVKPEWPRRLMSISHQSADVKPALSTMGLWRWARCAIDATYVPAWETNTGMVWALFGASPAIVRVNSTRYEQSVWCRRESELAQHLIDRLDFLSGRMVLDIDVEDLHAIDILPEWEIAEHDLPVDPLSSIMAQFPPRCEVWTPPPMALWEVKLLRAGGAPRAMHVFLEDPELVNRIVADVLVRGIDLPGPAPTNHPTGWSGYASIFRALVSETGDTASPLRLPVPIDAAAAALDDEVVTRIPDLSSGTPALGDVLVAVEFLRTEWPVLVDEGRGRFLLIDCQGASRAAFMTDERFSLHRGLLALRLPGPVWILQSAGQSVEDWGFPGDHPIFTQHTEHQFSWMFQISLDRRYAQQHYPRHSGLELSPALRRLCENGG